MEKPYRWLWLLLLIPALIYGCGTNPDAAHLYQLEKVFYEAQRAGSAAGIGPAGVNEADFIRIAGLYGEVVDYYQAVKGEFLGDSTSETVRSAELLAVQSSLRMAALLGTTKQWEQAIGIYRDLSDDYPEARTFHSVAEFELGRLYERLRQWDSSFAVYHRLMYTHHPPADTLSGYDMDWLRIPLHIAEVYNQLDSPESAGAWIDSGLVFYERLRNEYGIGMVNTLAKTHLASALRLTRDFQRAIDVYRTIRDSAQRILPQAQVEIGNIFYEQMRMPDSALLTFKDLVAERPDSPTATIAQTKIAAIYIDQNKYQEARDLLRPLKEAYEKKGQIVAGIMLLLGRSYEKEGAWDRALNEYSWLVENFPSLQQSMDISLHVIGSMAEAENMTVARQWQRKARQNFQKIIADNSRNELAAKAQMSLARSYAILEKWDEAAEEYQTLLNTYPPAASRLKAYLELSSVYVEKLRRPDQGAAVLEKLLADFPNFRQKDEIRSRIDYLKSKES